ncbi:CRISPR/Cas system-associated exonuclease Cas4 (RecB family) [Anaerosolibacter carboniphilus]|uniref:CRISPR/Cas system-associated exonuclease Cas4 (RecB family) n=1 Tax=Anaerosolibacter carboniphilus TaxID=1417629 RepID=A0A841KPM6_9FIRM|nr:PD-(D/E)XK nuclease family protein [Anaerosolibacter carboniphilus]MBB6214050.1 CRISPR/Cas system-associated exonuclease Cas4 (RecB family) [Anaerosolibacter carboniphilus]
MKETRLEQLYFSQYGLQLFQGCPLRFKKRYLEGLTWKLNRLANSDVFHGQEQGRLFHILAERYFLGIPTGIEKIHQEKTLHQWMEALKLFLPVLPENQYFPEFELRLHKGEVKLQGKYDLIRVDREGKVTIFDWKTEEKILSLPKVQRSFQTILYRFLMVEAGAAILRETVKPENIHMIYWQPNHPGKAIKLAYTTELYEQDKKFLESMIKEIKAFDFDAYHKEQTDVKICRYCEYHSICHKQPGNYDRILTEDEDNGE